MEGCGGRMVLEAKPVHSLSLEFPPRKRIRRLFHIPVSIKIKVESFSVIALCITQAFFNIFAKTQL